MDKDLTMVVTDTAGLLDLIASSQGRNRSVDQDFINTLDPDGNHVLFMQFVHNDVELRTGWLAKTKDVIEPATIWLDVAFEAFVTNTQKLSTGEVMDASRNEPTFTHG